MDEKELVRRARKSIKAGRSDAKIISGIQGKGYKLAYAHEILKKAKRPKEILIVAIISIIVLASVLFAVYALVTTRDTVVSSDAVSNNYYSKTSGSAGSRENSVYENPGDFSGVNSVQKENIFEPTTTMITSLLESVGVESLHKSFLNFEKPIINFRIGNKKFYSEISKGVETFEGENSKADLIFYVDESDFSKAMTSGNLREVFVDSVNSGESSVEMLAGEVELFSKGYLDLYNSLK